VWLKRGDGGGKQGFPAAAIANQPVEHR
jgi:hypothetical protein